MNMRTIFDWYRSIVVFDTETNGLDANKCQIIELAFMKLTRTEHGTFRMKHSDIFVKLPDGEKLPKRIIELTGITDELLETEGVSEQSAAQIFQEYINGGGVLLVAHNAQFDLLFVKTMLERQNVNTEALKSCDYLDTLTVYKDRRAYPHKLANAIVAYNLQDKVQNSHRAIDDVAALWEVLKAMDEEREDLLEYVNLFGFNKRYGVNGPKLKNVTYAAQRFNNYMTRPSATLPAIVKEGGRL